MAARRACAERLPIVSGPAPITSDHLAPQQSNSLLRPIILVVVGIFLIWIILTRSLAASLAETQPDTALVLQPHEPRALLKLAKSKLVDFLQASGQEQPSFNQQRSVDSADGITNLARLAEKVFAPVIVRRTSLTVHPQNWASALPKMLRRSHQL